MFKKSKRRVSPKQRRLSTRVARKSPKRVTRKSPKRSKRYQKCKKMLSEKIAININEYKEGKYKSRKQAIAVSYSQVRKKSPVCDRLFSISPK